MYIGAAFKKQILAGLQQEPLGEGEYRLIPNAGSHYISLSPTWANEAYLFAVPVLDGYTVYLYKKLS